MTWWWFDGDLIEKHSTIPRGEFLRDFYEETLALNTPIKIKSHETDCQRILFMHILNFTIIVKLEKTLICKKYVTSYIIIHYKFSYS